jgi:hypothetical protein
VLCKRRSAMRTTSYRTVASGSRRRTEVVVRYLCLRGANSIAMTVEASVAACPQSRRQKSLRASEKNLR